MWAWQVPNIRLIRVFEGKKSGALISLEMRFVKRAKASS